MSLFATGDRSAGKAREVMRAQYGNNLYAHDNTAPSDGGAGQRNTATFKSNFSFNAAGPQSRAEEHNQK